MPSLVEIGPVVLEKIFKICHFFFLYLYYLPFEKVVTLHLKNINPLHPGIFCAKFGLNWLSDSGKEDFYILSTHFSYFVITSPWKNVGPSFEQT